MSKSDLTPYDMEIKFHDNRFDCAATLTNNGCRKSPFNDETIKELTEFSRKCGKIQSITIKFKK